MKLDVKNFAEKLLSEGFSSEKVDTDDFSFRVLEMLYDTKFFDELETKLIELEDERLVS